MVQPHFDYCNTVWGNWSENQSSNSQKLQNRAARVLTFSNYDRSTSELFQNLKWLTLAHQRVVSKAIMMHSIVNNKAPEYLTSCFVRRCDLTSYNLRTRGLTTRSLKTRDFLHPSVIQPGVLQPWVPTSRNLKTRETRVQLFERRLPLTWG